MNLITTKYIGIVTALAKHVTATFGGWCEFNWQNDSYYLLTTNHTSDYIQGYIQGIYRQYDKPILTKDLEDGDDK